jgi:cytochrome c oxidase subunit 2
MGPQRARYAREDRVGAYTADQTIGPAERWAVAALVVAVLAVVGCTGPKEGKARGQALWDGCVQCHGDNGEGRELIQAPAIAGLQQWYVESQLTKFKNGQRGAHPGDIPGLKMRPMAMTLKSDTDIKAMAEFVASLPAVDPPAELKGGDVEKGKAKYAVCLACHGPDAGGMLALNSPNLTAQADWYLLSQLKKLKTGVRGKAPGDATGMQMQAIASTLGEDDMKDVVAYIMTLPLKAPAGQAVQ